MKKKLTISSPPPATPLRGSRRDQSIPRSKPITAYLSHKKMPDDTENAMQPQLQNADNTTLKKTIQPTEAKAMDEPKAINVVTVMEMFKTINSRLDVIEAKQDEQSGAIQNPENSEILKLDYDSKVSALQEQVKNLRRENFVLDRVAKMSLQTISDLNNRVAKLELNVSRKTVSISGLIVYSKNKDEIVREVEYFFESELNLRLRLEDVYFVGQGDPPICIVIFSTLQDKREVMRNKSMLRNTQNSQGKPIFINEFWTTEANEKRKVKRDIFIQNQEKPAEDKISMGYVGSKLYIGTKTVYEAKRVKTPLPTEVLDLEICKLNRVLRLIIGRGDEILCDRSRFIGYSAPVHSFEEIQEMYLKVKLIHPSADHVICAYSTDFDQNELFNSDFCDDGEHGAGRQLLNYMKEKDIHNRVIFVVRFFGGEKLGTKRFECILKAAESVLNNSPVPVSGTPERRQGAHSSVTQHPTAKTHAVNDPTTAMSTSVDKDRIYNSPNPPSQTSQSKNSHHGHSARGRYSSVS